MLFTTLAQDVKGVTTDLSGKNEDGREQFWRRWYQLQLRRHHHRKLGSVRKVQRAEDDVWRCWAMTLAVRSSQLIWNGNFQNPFSKESRTGLIDIDHTKSLIWENYGENRSLFLIRQKMFWSLRQQNDWLLLRQGVFWRPFRDRYKTFLL